MNNDRWVPMPPDDWEMSIAMGGARQFTALQQGRRDRNGRPRDGYRWHILGAKGEGAAHLMFGLEPRYLVGTLDKDQGDVVIPGLSRFRIQTRTRRNYDDRLCVGPNDDAGDVYLFFTPHPDGRPFGMMFRGWAWGREVNVWDATLPWPAYTIDTARLHSFAELCALITRFGGRIG